MLKNRRLIQITSIFAICFIILGIVILNINSPKQQEVLAEIENEVTDIELTGLTYDEEIETNIKVRDLVHESVLLGEEQQKDEKSQAFIPVPGAEIEVNLTEIPENPRQVSTETNVAPIVAPVNEPIEMPKSESNANKDEKVVEPAPIEQEITVPPITGDKTDISQGGSSNSRDDGFDESLYGKTNSNGETYVPGFGWRKLGETVNRVNEEMYENGNKIGIMD